MNPQRPTYQMVFFKEKAPAPAAAKAPPASMAVPPLLAPNATVNELTIFFRMKGLAIPMHLAMIKKTEALKKWKFEAF